MHFSCFSKSHQANQMTESHNYDLANKFNKVIISYYATYIHDYVILINLSIASSYVCKYEQFR